KILNSEERIFELEYEIYNRLRERITEAAVSILKSTKALAWLDVLQGFSHIAALYNYSCPIVDNSDEIVIKEGRHPIIERILESGRFVPNDTFLNNLEHQIMLITGPNMAGKSTYLRQVALIVIMAQTGSFVPAREARIGVVDKIFSRIGASDDLARGVSTFLAEMMETANILNNATPRSLIIFDELGRGTATYDGLSLAWAVIEYLHNNNRVKAKTIFATHYHELTDIAKFLTGVKNMNFIVKEYGDDIIFLRKLEPGASDRSYGISVAKLAGLPGVVLTRAREILAGFEEGERLSVDNISGTGMHQMNLFSVQSAEKEKIHPVLERLKELKIDSITPIEALNLLNELKQKVDKRDE
ncbi:MAG: DNA mismatch repair protein MutS, partial [candidate division WOR-3 bacterium]